MSAYEDFKQALQDFVTPEQRAITAQIHALAEVMAAQFQTIDERIKRLEDKIGANHREVMTALNLDKRTEMRADRAELVGKIDKLTERVHGDMNNIMGRDREMDKRVMKIEGEKE